MQNKIVSTNSYYRSAIGAFIINEKNQLLVILKHNYINKWDIIKGGIEAGEDQLEALKREIKEELGIDSFEILGKSKISLVKTKGNHKEIINEHMGQAWNNFWIRISSETELVIPNEEIEKYAWIDVTPENIAFYFQIHDEEKVLQTFLPIELAEFKVN